MATSVACFKPLLPIIFIYAQEIGIIKLDPYGAALTVPKEEFDAPTGLTIG